MKNRLGFTRSVSFWVYVAKCLIGLAVCYAINESFPGYKLYWSMVSVLLVISPDDLESRKLPVVRIKANVIGSSVGLICFILPVPSFPSMAIGVILTIIVCYFFDLGAGTRSALAALVIVLVQEFSEQHTVSAFQRMISVILGCFIALVVSLVFSWIRDGMVKSSIKRGTD
jgi:uncharacterized membrane protein YgaE (UPF0421/DUF939 family)